jgi:hypothetical protein
VWWRGGVVKNEERIEYDLIELLHTSSAAAPLSVAAELSAVFSLRSVSASVFRAESSLDMFRFSCECVSRLVSGMNGQVLRAMEYTTIKYESVWRASVIAKSRHLQSLFNLRTCFRHLCSMVLHNALQMHHDMSPAKTKC